MNDYFDDFRDPAYYGDFDEDFDEEESAIDEEELDIGTDEDEE